MISTTIDNIKGFVNIIFKLFELRKMYTHFYLDSDDYKKLWYVDTKNTKK